MEKLRLILLALLLAACGDPGAGDSFNNDDVELGSVGQPVTAKKSPTFSIGYGENLKLCQNSGGPDLCIVPGHAMIRYKIEGSQQCTSIHNQWKYQVERALTSSIPAGLINYNAGNSFGVMKDEQNPNVIFKNGACAGSINSSSMGSFVCFGGASNPLSSLTESLPQWYYRHTGVLTIYIDEAKIRLRAGSCSQYSENHHELTEHAAHIAALMPYGGAMYPYATCNGAACFPSWDTPVVQPSMPGYSTYSAGGYSAGLMCRIGSLVQDQATGILTLNSGCQD